MSYSLFKIIRKTMKINVKDQVIELKNTFRSHIIFEKIAEKSFKGDSFTDIALFFYSTIMASNGELDFTFDEFIELIDSNPSLITDFIKWLTSVNKVQGELNGKQATSDKPKASKKKK